MFSATMHRVHFSHLEVPADFAKKKRKKVCLGLDIKVQFGGKKIILWRFKNYPPQIVFLWFF